MRFLEISVEKHLRNLIFTRAMQIIVICLTSLVLTQAIKIVIALIKTKKINWRLFISTGGFPSSHCALVMSLCVSLGMFQYNIDGTLDWSFAVAVILGVIVIHDAMGVRLEASKHARILNNMAADMSDEEKTELGYGEKGKLKEKLGHKGFEVVGGIVLGTIVGLIGFLIAV